MTLYYRTCFLLTHIAVTFSAAFWLRFGAFPWELI
jgi:hypothetical protein